MQVSKQRTTVSSEVVLAVKPNQTVDFAVDYEKQVKQ